MGIRVKIRRHHVFNRNISHVFAEFQEDSQALCGDLVVVGDLNSVGQRFAGLNKSGGGEGHLYVGAHQLEGLLGGQGLGIAGPAGGEGVGHGALAAVAVHGSEHAGVKAAGAGHLAVFVAVGAVHGDLNFAGALTSRTDHGIRVGNLTGAGAIRTVYRKKFIPKIAEGVVTALAITVRARTIHSTISTSAGPSQSGQSWVSVIL